MLFRFNYVLHADGGIRDWSVTGVQTCALPIYSTWDKFAQGLFYCPGNIDKPEDYQRLKQFLAELDRKSVV